MSGPDWEVQRERSSRFWVELLAWIAQHLGRSVARIVLWPTVLYFLLSSASARAASRNYLRRVLPRTPGLLDVARHFHCFAACAVDRLLIAAGRTQSLHINLSRINDPLTAARGGRGCIMLVAHIGSFEILRTLGDQTHQLPLRVLLDREHGQIFTRLLERLNPAFANTIIDASQRGPSLVLNLKQALMAGDCVGIMADRVRGDEPTVEVDFLGGRIRLPASPWIFASSLKVPVVLAVGLYRGGARYDLHLELLADRIELSRARRKEMITEWAQRYADRLAVHARSAPYNWFNFYPYWI
jgi:predicted LPLAT superfamily acyltransferase